MTVRLKAMWALATLGYSAEEYSVLADLIVWTLEQPGEYRGWFSVMAAIVERYEAAKVVMA